MDLKAPPPSPIKDATEATFMADVIEASNEVPVIVDFWAPWCGPCKTLTPALEKAVTEAKGKVRLVKVDVDQNQRIAAQMRVQSIPAVFAFVGGQPVDGFLGAQSPAQIKAFVDRLIAMSGGNAGLEEALGAGRGDAGARGRPRTRPRPSPRSSPRTRATSRRWPGWRGRTWRSARSSGRARSWRWRRRPRRTMPRSLAARAQIELAEASAERRRDARSSRRRSSATRTTTRRATTWRMALVGKGDQAGAIEALLELFRRDREWNDGAAKTQLFKLFDSLGPKSEAAQKGRRRLSSMIFA